ncbi:hypothetical protein EDD11_007801 [Mortierella claussenii]|nr:hypothetical protein EDD11_007801 [Mortierella claussenii]
MSPSTQRTRRLIMLSLAITLATSLIAQLGHALPAAAHPPTSPPSQQHVRSVQDKSQQQPTTESPSIIVNTSEMTEPMKKQKKKKPAKTFGPPHTRQAPFRRPIFDLESLPDFNLQPFSTPWRHRMTYSIQWSIGPQFLAQIAAAQRHTDRNRDRNMDVAASQSVPFNFSMSQIMMDLQLVPLDPAKSNELLLSRVPITSHEATILVRTDIPEDWYRLEIQFWHESNDSSNGGRNHNSWDLSSSRLIISPGIVHSDPGLPIPREVGIWRSEEAIKVTSLLRDFKEWDEFVEMVSHEVQQERLALKNYDSFSSRQGLQDYKDAVLEEYQSQEEFRMPNPPKASPWHSRIKSLILAPWKSTPSSTFERTHFPQESFRFKEAMSVVTGRDGYPDYGEEELEAMAETESANDQPYPPSSANDMDALTELWSKATAPETESYDDSLDEDESYESPSADLSNAQITIENGKDVMPFGTAATWRANRDRTIGWQTSDQLIQDHVLLAVELIEVPSQLLPSTESSASPKSSITREELIEKSLEQPRIALLTDRIPASWGAIVARMPTWVQPGTYQIRLKGVGHQGVQWAEVSQPFVVQSDPFLYV